MAQLIRPLRQWPRINLHCCCRRGALSNLSSSSVSQSRTTQTAGHRFILFGSTLSVSFSRKLHFQARGLRLPNYPLAPSDYQEDDSGDSDGDGRKSRNKKKRDARRAVRWGMELASFSTPQIKRILRGASLEVEVFEALMIVKRLGHDVREGKRRQFNYIGKLLREVQPELMDALIQATKDGDHSRLQDLTGSGTSVTEDEDTEAEQPDQEEEDEEDSDECIDIATRWLDGLINKDLKITNEVYSINSVEFDRQELRKLVREVHKIQEQAAASENKGEEDVATTSAKKFLNRFLRSLAKQMSSDMHQVSSLSN